MNVTKHKCLTELEVLRTPYFLMYIGPKYVMSWFWIRVCTYRNPPKIPSGTPKTSSHYLLGILEE